MSNQQIVKKIETLFEPGGEGYTALVGALERACIGVEGSAKRRAPVKFGTLRSSITHDVVGDEMTGYIGTNVPYAPYVEIGTGIYSTKGDGRKTPWMYMDISDGSWHVTRGSHPHPFLKPAVDENLTAIEKCFEGIL